MGDRRTNFKRADQVGEPDGSIRWRQGEDEARAVDFSQGPAIRPAAPALLRKLRRSVISVSPYLSWRELHTMNFR